MAQLPLPIDNSIPYPSAVRDYPNGKIPSSVLGSFQPLTTLAVVRLAPVAIRTARALVGRAREDGFLFGPTSLYDSYRPFEIQDSVFRARYRIVGWDTGLWYDGHWWLKRDGVAAAAVPGTSNHGKAVAVDWRLAGGGITDAASNWLVRYGPSFGWYAELASERWHWKHATGDVVRPAVIEWENDMAEFGDKQVEQLECLSQRVGQIFVKGEDEYDKTWTPDATDKEQPWFIQELAWQRQQIEAQNVALGQILAKLDGGSTPAGHAHPVSLTGLTTSFSGQTGGPVPLPPAPSDD